MPPPCRIDDPVLPSRWAPSEADGHRHRPQSRRHYTFSTPIIILLHRAHCLGDLAWPCSLRASPSRSFSRFASSLCSTLRAGPANTCKGPPQRPKAYRAPPACANLIILARDQGHPLRLALTQHKPAQVPLPPSSRAAHVPFSRLVPSRLVCSLACTLALTLSIALTRNLHVSSPPAQLDTATRPRSLLAAHAHHSYRLNSRCKTRASCTGVPN